MVSGCIPDDDAIVMEPSLILVIIWLNSVSLFVGSGNCEVTSLASLYSSRKEEVSVGRGAVKKSDGFVAKRLMIASSGL